MVTYEEMAKPNQVPLAGPAPEVVYPSPTSASSCCHPPIQAVCEGIRSRQQGREGLSLGEELVVPLQQLISRPREIQKNFQLHQLEAGLERLVERAALLQPLEGEARDLPEHAMVVRLRGGQEILCLHVK